MRLNFEQASGTRIIVKAYTNNNNVNAFIIMLMYKLMGQWEWNAAPDDWRVVKTTNVVPADFSIN